MPSPLAQTHLLILQDDTGRRELTLVEPRYVIGRDPQSDILLVSKFVSRRHAILMQHCHEDGTTTYQVMDGDGQSAWSTNGILVNGHKRRSRILEHGDVLTFGPGVGATYYALHDCPEPNTDGSLPTRPVDLDP
jgi:pSer/pThr/pTyr-binding forkhead associated (FHA) protein